MARPQGAAGHRTEVVSLRLTPQEKKRFIDDRKGSLTESAYVRWVLTKAADTDPHGNEPSDAQTYVDLLADEDE